MIARALATDPLFSAHETCTAWELLVPLAVETTCRPSTAAPLFPEVVPASSACPLPVIRGLETLPVPLQLLDVTVDRQSPVAPLVSNMAEPIIVQVTLSRVSMLMTESTTTVSPPRRGATVPVVVGVVGVVIGVGVIGVVVGVVGVVGVLVGIRIAGVLFRVRKVVVLALVVGIFRIGVLGMGMFRMGMFRIGTLVVGVAGVLALVLGRLLKDGRGLAQLVVVVIRDGK